MKILHAIEGLDRASGVATFVHEVADEQARCGHEVAVIFVATDELVFDPRVCKVSQTKFSALPWRPDVVHLHGIWSRFSLKVLFWCRWHHIPYVVSPHGGLMPRVFTHGAVKKRLVWSCLLRPLLACAKVIHGTTETEVDAFRSADLKGTFVVAPLGCHLPCEQSDAVVQDQQHVKTVLFLGRLGEEKGLAILLDAWNELHLAPELFRLVLAGPDWCGYRAILEQKISSEHIHGVIFTGNADEVKKDRLYRMADLFVLPSPMENFSMVVLDALAYGVPVIATKGTPWSDLEKERCGWWIEQGVESLRNALQGALSLAADVRAAMGKRGRDLAARKYQWPAISEKLLSCYAHFNGGASELTSRFK